MFELGIAMFVVIVLDTDGEGLVNYSLESSILIIFVMEVGNGLASLLRLLWLGFEYIVVLGCRDTATVCGLNANEVSRLPNFESWLETIILWCPGIEPCV